MTKKSSCRVVMTSDWHLNKLERFFPDHLEKQKIEIRKPLLYALKHGVTDVIVPGDISENPTLDGIALTMLLSILNEFDEKLNIHFILGNHDFAHVEAHSLAPLEELCRAHKFKTIFVYTKPQHVKIQGIHFNMLPFPFVRKNKPYTEGPSVNVAHLEWNGAMRDNGKSRITKGYSDGDSGVDVWLIGHLHTPQYLAKPRVLYCGTPYQTNFGENADKSFCDIRFKMKNGRLLFKFKRIPQRCHFYLMNVEITDARQFADLKKDLNCRYKLWIAEDVKIPKRLTLDYPNIDALEGARGAVSDEGEESVVNVDEMEEVTLTTGLRESLRARGLKKPQIKRARSILKELGVPLK